MLAAAEPVVARQSHRRFSGVVPTCVRGRRLASSQASVVAPDADHHVATCRCWRGSGCHAATFAGSGTTLQILLRSSCIARRAVVVCAHGYPVRIFDHIEVRGGKSAEEIYEDRIAIVKRAEEGGFYAFHLAEHHGHELSSSPTAAVFLAALARETTRLKLIPTVVCLPLHHPVRVFEELAMLDVLCHGRLELGMGKGITPFEHLQFGHPPEEASARSKEILPIC